MIKQCSGLLARTLLVVGLLIVSVDVVKANDLKGTFEKMVQEYGFTEEQTDYLALLIPKVVELQNYTGRGIIFLLGIPSCNSDSSLSYFSLLSL